ncbi:MAG TPA: MOSC domain-containing protein [Aggregatilineales bacterium]|nr:MOSC domain-containing protein [Aggregatilineales bacterium]
MTETQATVLSIQVGMPTEHGADAISKKAWQSGIFKYPVEGRIWLDSLNLTGDGQDDLKNHGGPFRAILTYGAAHYPVWREELGRADLAYGAFGENLTVSELTEDLVCLGDIYQVGEARVQVSQPRFPCWKLARRNQIVDLTAKVEARGWGGWYQRVLQTGYIETGDSYTLLERPYPNYTIALLNDITSERRVEPAICQELATIEALTPTWREIYGRMATQ